MDMFDKNISEEKRKSLEFAEESRESEWKYPSFVLKLFHGELDWDMIHPFPVQSAEDKKLGDAFLDKLEAILREKLDPEEVDRSGIIPDKVIKALAEIKAFAIKIPEKYNGLGLSQTNYSRAMHLVASYCGSTAVLLSAHQSIGVPQPLKLFGTEEQKSKYLPMFANGTISAFALTETEAGSDPRTMKTTATPTQDGNHFLINGEKLWCTNGPIAGVIVVMAVTPPKIVNGKERKQITAFIVETKSPGFSVVHRCRFMGLNGLQNGLLAFKDVKVPKENIILGEGEGLKLALMTLNTGRLTVPAASAGVSKWCLNVAKKWSAKRIQWGNPIGEHESIAKKLGYLASHTFAIDAVSWLTASMAQDKKFDIRIEAAIAKYFSTEHGWEIADQTLQIRGGQGYERADSLKKRKMDAWPVERVLRDIRINRIIEGTSEIMHLFIAREALDPHLSRMKPLFEKSPMKNKAGAILGLLRYYCWWYPRLWLPSLKFGSINDVIEPLQGHLVYVGKASKRLARHIFHQMVRYQQNLESKQCILNRIVDIGTDLFIMSVCCTYADMLRRQGKETENSVDLADLFCREARLRVEKNFKDNDKNNDKMNIKVANKLLTNDFLWIENDIIK